MSSIRSTELHRTTATIAATILAASFIAVLDAPSASADRPTDPGSSASARAYLDIEQVVTLLKQQRVRDLIAHARELRAFG